MKVRLPGVRSAASIAVEIVGEDVLEVVARAAHAGGDESGEGPGLTWKLTHALPFAPRSDANGDVGASKVKFGKKTSTLTLVFERRPASGGSGGESEGEPEVEGSMLARDGAHAARGEASASRRPPRSQTPLDVSPPSSARPSSVAGPSPEIIPSGGVSPDASPPGWNEPGSPAWDAQLRAAPSSTRSPGGESPPAMALPVRWQEDETSARGMSFADNPRLYLADRPGKGRHLRARCALHEGDLLHEGDALVAAVHDRHVDTTCTFCFRRIATKRARREAVRCGSCGGALYCGARCRQEDESHVGECALVRRAATDPRLQSATRGLRLFLRLLFVRASRADLFEAVEDLQSHFDDMSADRQANMLGMARAVNSLLPPPAQMPEMALAEVMSKVHTNLHGVVDAAGRALGSGLYPAASMFNHSCHPNAVVSFGPGRRLRVRAIAPIAEGEEVCIAYTELYATAAARRAALRSKKAFVCECRRCVDPEWQRADLPLSGWACVAAKPAGRGGKAGVGCGGVVPAGDERCIACGTTCGVSIRERDQLEQRWIAAHTRSLELLQAGKHAGAAAAAEAVLVQSQSMLAEHHVVRHECRLIVADARFALGDWAAAAAAAREAAAGMREHLPGNHPGRAHMLNVLADALVNQVEAGRAETPGVALAEAAAAYRRAAGILDKTYGDDHEATATARANEQATRLQMQTL